MYKFKLMQFTLNKPIIVMYDPHTLKSILKCDDLVKIQTEKDRKFDDKDIMFSFLKQMINKI